MYESSLMFLRHDEQDARTVQDEGHLRLGPRARRSHPLAGKSEMTHIYLRRFHFTWCQELVV